MFKKIKNDVVSIKKSLADILGTLEYLKLQSAPHFCKSASGDELRNLMLDVAGHWVFVPDFIAKKIGITSGAYFVFGFIANDMIGFSENKNERMVKIHMYCVKDVDCRNEDIGRDGVSVDFNEINLGKRIKHIPLSPRDYANTVLLALKENIMYDAIFMGTRVR